MNKFLKYYIFVLLLTTSYGYGQSGWVWQNPLPQGNSLFTLFFFDELTGYAFGDQGTFIKTTTGGNTWITQHNINNSNRIYGCWFLNPSTGWITSGSNILKTTNGGNNWILSLVSTPQNTFFENIKFSDSLNGFAILRCIPGLCPVSSVYKSTNGGINWFSVYTNLYEVATMDYQGDNAIYVITNKRNGYYRYSRLMKSTNSGLNWQEILYEEDVIYNSLSFINESTGWIGTDENIRYTTNGGDSWTIYPDLPTGIIMFWDNDNGLRTRNNNTLKTTNAGQDWSSVNSLSGSALFAKNQVIYEIGYGGAILKSTDAGSNWFSHFQNYYDFLDEIFFVNSTTGWSVGGSEILKTTNSGNNWFIQYDSANRYFFSVSFVNESTGWVVGTVILKTTNSGQNWIVQEGSGSYVFFIDESYGWIGGEFANSILYTTNGGNNWLTSNLPSSFHCKDVHFLNRNTGYLPCDQGILKTTNGGIHWEIVYTGLNFRSIFVVDQNTIFAGGSGKFLKSTNAGLSWQVLFSQFSIFSIYFPSSLVGYAGYEGTLIKTTDGGDNWFYQMSPSHGIKSIFFINELTGWIAGAYGNILKTTDGGGSILPIGINNYSGITVTDFSLSQNYPNPFNPATKIKFDVPKASFTKLIIYDLLGREVAVLVNEELKPGTYQADWNASNYSSGVYFYKIVSGDFVETKKMVLMK